MAETCIKCSKCGHWVSTWCSECIGENEQQAVEKALKQEREFMADTILNARKDAVEKAMMLNEGTQKDILRLLSDYCGEDGDNEGATETLKRLLSELKRRRTLPCADCKPKHEAKRYDCPTCMTAREDGRRKYRTEDARYPKPKRCCDDDY